jgi:hypothetical protein
MSAAAPDFSNDTSHENAPGGLIERLRWISLTYYLPTVVAMFVIVAGLWCVSDSLFGMYGNVDGKWTSWDTRALLEWSSFLDFGPFTPLAGTGTLLKPNLPWLNPGALALAIPVPLPYRHLISYLVYAAELSASCYFLFRELSLNSQWAVVSVLFYLLIFFIPMESIADVPSWYALGPFIAHLAAAMNIATVALLRVGKSRLLLDIIWGVVFIACVFSAFASAPIDVFLYVPVYAALWAVLCLRRSEWRALLPRVASAAVTTVLFWSVGAVYYLQATAAVSARGESEPPFLYPRTALLSEKYWRELLANASLCGPYGDGYLLCLHTLFGWIQLTALIGGCFLIIFTRGTSRALGIFTVLMIAFLHFDYLLTVNAVLGPLSLIGYHYLYWGFYPMVCATVVLFVAMASQNFLPRRLQRWLPAIVGNAIALIAAFKFLTVVLPNQPITEGKGSMGLRPIAHTPVRKGSILHYLSDHAALSPGKEFEGYVGTYFSENGWVHKVTSTDPNSATHALYVSSREILSAHFGDMFQLTDLWNSNIPTFEEYGQWLTRQMFQFDETFLADRGDGVDSTGVTTHIYRLVPPILRLLGVRFVITDGTLSEPELVLRETEMNETQETMKLYELTNPNLGNYSPTRIIQAQDYASAIAYIHDNEDGLENTAVIFNNTSIPAANLVPATKISLKILKGGYHIEARSSGKSLLVLPIQFSNCFHLSRRQGKESLVRANLVQTGIYFEAELDTDVLFRLPLWDASCRLDDAREMPHVLKRAPATKKP